jgi:hypothetical protein
MMLLDLWEVKSSVKHTITGCNGFLELDSLSWSMLAVFAVSLTERDRAP